MVAYKQRDDRTGKTKRILMNEDKIKFFAKHLGAEIGPYLHTLGKYNHPPRNPQFSQVWLVMLFNDWGHGFTIQHKSLQYFSAAKALFTDCSRVAH